MMRSPMLPARLSCHRAFYYDSKYTKAQHGVNVAEEDGSKCTWGGFRRVWCMNNAPDVPSPSWARYYERLLGREVSSHRFSDDNPI
jgi:hypothetical protein